MKADQEEPAMKLNPGGRLSTEKVTGGDGETARH